MSLLLLFKKNILQNFGAIFNMVQTSKHVKKFNRLPRKQVATNIIDHLQKHCTIQIKASTINEIPLHLADQQS